MWRLQQRLPSPPQHSADPNLTLEITDQPTEDAQAPAQSINRIRVTSPGSAFSQNTPESTRPLARNTSAAIKKICGVPQRENKRSQYTDQGQSCDNRLKHGLPNTILKHGLLWIDG